jgi:signal transduction histidine kinase
MKKGTDAVDIHAFEDGNHSILRGFNYLLLACFLCILIATGAGLIALETDLSYLPAGTEHTRDLIFIGVLANAVLLVLFGVLMSILKRGNDRQEINRQKARQLELASIRMFNSQEQEKRLVAWKLHEGTAQTLVAIKTRVELACKHDSRGGVPDNAEHLRAVLPIIQDAIHDVRSIAVDLRPSSLDDLGVIPTLRWLCGKVESLYPGLLVETQVEIQEQDIPRALKVSIFRVAQEVLYALAPNAGDDSVRLVLRPGGGSDSIELGIESTAAVRALENATTRSAQVALSRLQERVMQTGGKFSLQRTRDKRMTLGIRASWQVQVVDQPYACTPILDRAAGFDISP